MLSQRRLGMSKEMLVEWVPFFAVKQAKQNVDRAKNQADYFLRRSIGFL